ncbi:hypothetical protein BGY98DRAFT_926894, partial [Russula aff. rugulosa BPL654]
PKVFPVQNANLPAALLSRFDSIFLLHVDPGLFPSRFPSLSVDSSLLSRWLSGGTGCPHNINLGRFLVLATVTPAVTSQGPDING